MKVNVDDYRYQRLDLSKIDVRKLERAEKLLKEAAWILSFEERKIPNSYVGCLRSHYTFSLSKQLYWVRQREEDRRANDSPGGRSG